jgi:hypothetical protein
MLSCADVLANVNGKKVLYFIDMTNPSSIVFLWNSNVPSISAFAPDRHELGEIFGIHL